MKLKYIKVTPEFLLEALFRSKPTLRKFEPELPKDTKIIQIEHQIRWFADQGTLNVYNIVLESEEFKEVVEGGVIPELEITVTEHTLEEVIK